MVGVTYSVFVHVFVIFIYCTWIFSCSLAVVFAMPICGKAFHASILFLLFLSGMVEHILLEHHLYNIFSRIYVFWSDLKKFQVRKLFFAQIHAYLSQCVRNLSSSLQSEQKIKSKYVLVHAHKSSLSKFERKRPFFSQKIKDKDKTCWK